MQSIILEKFNSKNYSPILTSYVVFVAGILGLQPDPLSLQGFLVVLSFFFVKAPVLIILTLAGFFHVLGGLFLDKLMVSIGEVVLNSEIFAALFSFMSDLPVVPLTRFSNTIYMGSLILTIVLTVGIYFLQFFRRGRNSKKINIRKKTSIPVLVGVAGFVLFMNFMVEPTMRFSLKKSLEIIGGSEVNIKSVDFSFINGLFAINDLQITDPNNPDRNLISFEKFHFQIDPVSVLKLKFIVEDAKLDNLLFSSKRRSLGWVKKGKGEKSNLSKVEKDQSKILRKISTMLSGFNPLVEIGEVDLSRLPSLLKAGGLTSDLENKKNELSKIVEELPDISRIETSLKNFSRLGKSRDLKTIQTDIKKLNKRKKEAGTFVKKLTTASATVAESITDLNDAIDDLDTDIKGDLDHVFSKLSLPDLEFNGLAEELFDKEIYASIVKLKVYYNYLKPHLEKSKDRKVDKTRSIFRDSGERVIFFNDETPAFWLKKASIKTLKTTDTYKDSLSGNIRNLTSSLDLTQLPMKFEVSGRLESLGIPVFRFDSRVTGPDNSVELNSSLILSGVSVANRSLSESESLNLKVKSSFADMKVGFGYKNQAVGIAFHTTFNNVKYDLQSDDDRLLISLKPIIESIDKLTLNAKGEGTFSDLSWKVSSNLSDRLKNGLTSTLSSQIASVKKTITKKIRGEIGLTKKDLYVNLREIQSKYGKEINSRLELAKKYTASVDKKIKDLNEKVKTVQSQVKDKVKREAEQKLKDALKSKLPKF